MSIFSRLFKVSQAHANKIVDKMENPELMLEQAIRDKENEIKESREKVQAVIATERQNKALIDKSGQEKDKWEERAKFALGNGNEELAAKALVRVEECEANIKSLSPGWQLQKDSVNSLKVALGQMEDELNELKRNKDILIAQAKTAEVKKSIYEAKASISKNDKTADLISRMRAKAERQTYEAEAAEELANSGNSNQDLEKQFETLKQGSFNPSIKSRLEAMKQQLNKPE